MRKLRKEIEEAINRASRENRSDTPDFILAEYLMDCLSAYERTLEAREGWREREGPADVQDAMESSAQWAQRLEEEH